MSVFVAEPGSREEKSWHMIVGTVRIHYSHAHWQYDYETKKRIFVPAVFFSWVDYGISSEWRGNM